MINMIAGLVSSLGGTFIKGWNAVKGNQQERDQQTFDLAGKVHDEFAAEFTAYRQNRTWWDSLIDGLNRLPRPVFVGLILTYFIFSWSDPDLFARINTGLATVPEPMWWMMGTIVGFYFASREFHHARKGGEFKQAAQVTATAIAGEKEKLSEDDLDAKYEDILFPDERLGGN